MNPLIYRNLSRIYFHPRTFPGWNCFITISPSLTTSSSANTSFPTSPNPDPSYHLLSFDTDPLLTTISGIGAPSIREPRYHRPESLCHIFEAANLLAHCRKKEPLTALGFSIPHNNIVQHSSVSSKESLCKHTKAFFSNSLTKQLLLLFLLGLKHVDRPLKGNFEKQAEPTSSLLLKLNNSTTNLYFVVLYQW